MQSRGRAFALACVVALAVFAIGAGLATILWVPLGLPSQLVRGVAPTSSCGGSNAATPIGGLCAFGVTALIFAVPLVLMALALLYRKAITARVARPRGAPAASAGLLVAPTIAALLFAIGWAGSHPTTGSSVGLVPQTFFPGVVALFTFVVTYWGTPVQLRIAPMLDARDRYPARLRLVAAIVVPLILSVIVAAVDRASHAALAEQLLVVFGLVFGFLILAPRAASAERGGTGRGANAPRASR